MNCRLPRAAFWPPTPIVPAAVLEGTVQVQSGEEERQLKTGDTARYFADRPHQISAEGPARAILIVQNS